MAHTKHANTSSSPFAGHNAFVALGATQKAAAAAETPQAVLQRRVQQLEAQNATLTSNNKTLRLANGQYKAKARRLTAGVKLKWSDATPPLGDTWAEKRGKNKSLYTTGSAVKNAVEGIRNAMKLACMTTSAPPAALVNPQRQLR